MITCGISTFSKIFVFWFSLTFHWFWQFFMKFPDFSWILHQIFSSLTFPWFPGEWPRCNIISKAIEQRKATRRYKNVLYFCNRKRSFDITTVLSNKDSEWYWSLFISMNITITNHNNSNPLGVCLMILYGICFLKSVEI